MGFSSQNIHHVIHYGIVEIYLKSIAKKVEEQEGMVNKLLLYFYFVCVIFIHEERLKKI